MGQGEDAIFISDGNVFIIGIQVIRLPGEVQGLAHERELRSSVLIQRQTDLKAKQIHGSENFIRNVLSLKIAAGEPVVPSHHLLRIFGLRFFPGFSEFFLRHHRYARGIRPVCSVIERAALLIVEGDNAVRQRAGQRLFVRFYGKLIPFKAPFVHSSSVVVDRKETASVFKKSQHGSDVRRFNDIALECNRKKSVDTLSRFLRAFRRRGRRHHRLNQHKDADKYRGQSSHILHDQSPFKKETAMLRCIIPLFFCLCTRGVWHLWCTLHHRGLAPLVHFALQ